MMLTLFTPVTVTYDPATTAWINAVVAAGGSVSTGRKTVVDNLIVGLKADSIWTKLDRLWIFAAENSQSALVDLVANSSATPSSSPTFTPDRSYSCNGTAIVNTGFIPSTNGVQFTLNTAHVSAWSLTSATSGQFTVNSGQTNMFLRYSDGNWYVRINNNAGGAGANSDGSGFHLGIRASPSSVLGYRNGSLLVNTGDGPVSLDSAQLSVMDRDISAVSVGGSMSSTDATNFYNRMRTYMTAVGVP
jgi:type V secretory pathway adhesin AidA